jgi:hypothetical protein
MALVGYELERSRIDAVIAEVEAELGNVGPGRSTATATSEPAAPRRKRFSAAARKRMAEAVETAESGTGGSEDGGKKSGEEVENESHCNA